MTTASCAAQSGLFETGVDAYRRQLAELKARAAALIKEIDEVPVGGVYCDSSDKRAAGCALAELRMELGDLERDWSAFQRNMASSVEMSGTGGQLLRAGIDPLAPNFWTASNQEVVQGPSKALEQKLERFRNTPVVGCNDPDARRRSPSPVERKKDPLAGLKRPARLLQGIPSDPRPFGTQEELEAWKRAIGQMLRENQNAATALRDYHDAVLDRLLAALRTVPTDTAAVRKLDGEVAWIKAEHDRLTKLYYQILAVYEKGTVVDCTQHLTTPQPAPSRDSTRAVGAPVDTTHPHTQERPGTGSPPPVDSLRPRTQEKPGTGTPPRGTEPPKTGALPGSKPGGGQWFVGVGVDENWYQQFAHTAGEQANIDGFAGKQTTLGWGVELGFAQSGWRVWACRHVNTLHYTQQYITPGSPFSRIDGDLDGSFYDFRLGRDVGPFWNTYVEVYGGVTFAYDKLEFGPVTPLGASLGDNTRTLDTWKTNFGLAVDRPLSSDFGLRLNATYTGAGKSSDADLNLRFGAGVTYKLPGNFGF